MAQAKRFKVLKRVLAGTAIVVLVTVLSLMATVQLAPMRAVGWIQDQTDLFKLEAQTLSLSWIPLSLSATELQLNVADLDIQAASLDGEMSLWAYLQDEPFWQLTASTVVVAEALASATATQITPEIEAEAEEVGAGLNIPSLAPLFSLLKLHVERLQLPILGLSADSIVNVEIEHKAGLLDYFFNYQDDKDGLQFEGELKPVAFTEEEQLISMLIRGDWNMSDHRLDVEMQSTIGARDGQSLQIEMHPLAMTYLPAQGPERYLTLATTSVNFNGNSGFLKVVGEGTYQVDGKTNQLPLSLSGQVRDLFGEPQIDMGAQFADLDIQVDGELKLPGYAAHIALSATGWPEGLLALPYRDDELFPLELNAEVAGDDNHLKINSLSLQSPVNDLAAQLQVSWMNDLTEIAGNLSAQNLQLPESAETEASTETAETSEASPTEVVELADEEIVDTPATDAESPLFTTEPLDWSWMQTVHTDIDVSVGTLQAGPLLLTDLEVAIHGNAQGYSLKPLEASLGGGSLTAQLQLTPGQDQEVDLLLNYAIKDVVLGALNLMPPEDLQGGQLNGSGQLKASGLSSLQLAQSLNGKIGLQFGELMLQSGLVDLVGSDVISEVLNRINPFRKEDPVTQMQCAVLQFDVQDGVVLSHDKLVVETSKMRVEAEAKINLPEEDLELTFSPRAKSGVGVGVGNLVKFLKLGGDLRSPGIQLDAVGVIQSGAAVGAAVSTLGVSMLAEGLVKRALSDSGCAQTPVEIPIPSEPGDDLLGGEASLQPTAPETSQTTQQPQELNPEPEPEPEPE